MQCRYLYPSMRHKNACKRIIRSPPIFGVEILFRLLHVYSKLYKGIKSFELVPWMQRQCSVGMLNVYELMANIRMALKIQNKKGSNYSYKRHTVFILYTHTYNFHEDVPLRLPSYCMHKKSLQWSSKRRNSNNK